MNDNLMIFSVWEVSLHLKQVIETQIDAMYVRGEISNFTHHSSGHMYFNLKDENATLRCTYFRNVNMRLDFKPQDGMEVVCFGKLTIYEKGGSYNLNVSGMSLSGAGALQLEFERLKQKLKLEGLFEQAHKKALPRYPERIGIVTSPSGAALQDIKNILTRRFPVIAKVYPAVVQGVDAPAQIIAGIKYFNQSKDVDLIIITRGGGSQEDLFCFNDEALARAIFASKLPVISAVGHEIDFTIADFVADLRAPTPSAAAELAVPNKRDLMGYIESVSRRMALTLSALTARESANLEKLHHRFAILHPEKLLQEYQQRFDMAATAVFDSSDFLIPLKHDFTLINHKVSTEFRYLWQMLKRQAELEMKGSAYKLEQLSRAELDHAGERLILESEKLRLASPETIMNKGFSMVLKNGKALTSVNDIDLGDKLDMIMKDGSAKVNVDEINPQSEHNAG